MKKMLFVLFILVFSFTGDMRAQSINPQFGNHAWKFVSCDSDFPLQPANFNHFVWHDDFTSETGSNEEEEVAVIYRQVEKFYILGGTDIDTVLTEIRKKPWFLIHAYRNNYTVYEYLGGPNMGIAPQWLQVYTTGSHNELEQYLVKRYNLKR